MLRHLRKGSASFEAGLLEFWGGNKNRFFNPIIYRTLDDAISQIINRTGKKESPPGIITYGSTYSFPFAVSELYALNILSPDLGEKWLGSQLI